MAALCAIDSVSEGQAKGFAIEADTFIVTRRDSQFFVYLNRCPHLGIPLEWLPNQFLDEDADLLRCSTHGALFTIESGLCVAGPCVGEHLVAVPFRIREGQIWLNR